jgi:polyisoprenoid-binding protein YceI
MKMKLWLAIVGAVLLSAWMSRGQAADAAWVRYDAASTGSKVKLDGTSTAHDWTVEGTLIGGYVEFDPAFDLANPKPGKVGCKTSVIIPVRQLKSGKVPMDNVMYDAMKQREFPRIEYRVSEATLKEAPKSATDPLVLETVGDLAMSGKTNKVSIPVTLQRLEGNQLKISGSTTLKMTSFGIEPPAPKIAGGLITTGDDVKLSFEWLTAKKGAAK